MIKVLVGENNAVFRRGLTSILNEQTGMQVLAEASTQKELFEKARTEKPDVIILEVSLPGKQTLDMVKNLKAEFPALPVVLMGDKHSDAQIAARTIKAGASVFLFKTSPPHEIIAAVHSATRGHRYIAAEIAQVLALESLGPRSQNACDVLSDRELQVLVMIASGKRLKEIAHDLSVSYNTVNTYRQRVLEKMDLKHNADLIRYALEHKLVDPI